MDNYIYLAYLNVQSMLPKPCRLQGLGGQTSIPSPEYPPTTTAETKLKAAPALGELFHTYEKVA